MYKVKNITKNKRKFYNPKTYTWVILNPQEEIEVEYKPQEHNSFEITQSNKNNKVQNNITEEKSSDKIQ